MSIILVPFRDKEITFDENSHTWYCDDISDVSLHKVKLRILTRKFNKKPYKHLYVYGMTSSIFYEAVNLFELDGTRYIIHKDRTEPKALTDGNYLIIRNTKSNLKIVKGCIKEVEDLWKIIKNVNASIHKTCVKSAKILSKLK